MPQIRPTSTIITSADSQRQRCSQEAQRTANPALNGVHHIQWAHSHHRTDEKARQQQREERVKLQLNDG
jgi:hypothetical protein